MIPWGDSVLKQANDAAQDISVSQWKLPGDPTAQFFKPSKDERPSEEHDLPARIRRPAVDQPNPNHMAQIEYAKHPSGRQLTAQEWNDKVTADKNKKLQNNGDSAVDAPMDDKKFTEDLHSRKSDGTFIESSGNSTKKYTHQE